MPEALGNLGQAALTNTLTDIITVPAATTLVVSCIVVCNRSATPTTFRISIAVAGAADATKQYIAYDAELKANEVWSWVIGLTLATTDVMRASAALSTVSIGIYGATET